LTLRWLSMKPRYMRTSDIAKAVGVHPNTVRLYEEWGFLPPIPVAPVATASSHKLTSTRCAWPGRLGFRRHFPNGTLPRGAISWLAAAGLDLGGAGGGDDNCPGAGAHRQVIGRDVARQCGAGTGIVRRRVGAVPHGVAALRQRVELTLLILIVPRRAAEAAELVCHERGEAHRRAVFQVRADSLQADGQPRPGQANRKGGRGMTAVYLLPGGDPPWRALARLHGDQRARDPRRRVPSGSRLKKPVRLVSWIGPTHRVSPGRTGGSARRPGDRRLR